MHVMVCHEEGDVTVPSATYSQTWFLSPVPSACCNNSKFTEYFHVYYFLYFCQLIGGACTRNTTRRALKWRQKLREFQLQQVLKWTPVSRIQESDFVVEVFCGSSEMRNDSNCQGGGKPAGPSLSRFNGPVNFSLALIVIFKVGGNWTGSKILLLS